MERIKVELTPAEAIIVHGKLTDAAVRAAKAASTMASGSIELELTQQVARISNSVADRISQELYPRCGWLDNDDCDMTPAGKAANGVWYCRFHLARLEAQVETLAAFSA